MGWPRGPARDLRWQPQPRQAARHDQPLRPLDRAPGRRRRHRGRCGGPVRGRAARARTLGETHGGCAGGVPGPLRGALDRVAGGPARMDAGPGPAPAHLRRRHRPRRPRAVDAAPGARRAALLLGPGRHRPGAGDAGRAAAVPEPPLFPVLRGPRRDRGRGAVPGGRPAPAAGTGGRPTGGPRDRGLRRRGGPGGRADRRRLHVPAPAARGSHAVRPDGPVAVVPPGDGSAGGDPVRPAGRAVPAQSAAAPGEAATPSPRAGPDRAAERVSVGGWRTAATPRSHGARCPRASSPRAERTGCRRRRRR